MPPINALFSFYIYWYGLPINTKLSSLPINTKLSTSPLSAMTPTTTLFTKTRNRWQHFMQLRSNPDFMHDDFEMFSRVRHSIEYLCLTSGLRKQYSREVGIRIVPQYQISPNYLFWGLFRGGRTRKIAHYAEIRYRCGKNMT